MATKEEIDCFLGDPQVPRNIRNRLESAIMRDYGRMEILDLLPPEEEMSPRVNGAYVSLKEQYEKSND